MHRERFSTARQSATGFSAFRNLDFGLLSDFGDSDFGLNGTKCAPPPNLRRDNPAVAAKPWRMSESLTDMKDQPASERPRERLVALGPDALTPAELIAILLRTGLKGTNVVEVGQDLLQQFGSLNALARASVDELRNVPGIGRDKAVTLVAAFALARRMEQERREESPVLDNPPTVVSFMREANRLKNVESFQVLLLNTRKRLIRLEEISHGLLDTIAGASARGVPRRHRGQRGRHGAGA